jgi:precorrin-3B C17-methyltransferase
MTGRLTIAGLGPGSADMVTPEVSAALAAATDVLGYAPYVARVAPRPGLTLHPTDNRQELERAAHALQLAREGGRVVVVSGGDPGVFAMASAVFEAATEPLPEICVMPGVTAMLAAAAAAGAPLGHDFCAINLSDNLKPQDLIDRRLTLAVTADFAIAMYNPRSVSRPEGFGHVLSTLRAAGAGDRLMIFARNVSRPDQAVRILPLREATPDMADMRTLVILCNSATRRIGPWVYAPRSAP